MLAQLAASGPVLPSESINPRSVYKATGHPANVLNRTYTVLALPTMPIRAPLSLLFLLQLGALLLALAAHASPVAAGDRVVFVRPSSSATSMAYWRRLEDEVAPEFPVGGLLGDDIHYGPLNPDNRGCPKGTSCAAKCNGCPYTRPCNYHERCPQGHD